MKELTRAIRARKDACMRMCAQLTVANAWRDEVDKTRAKEKMLAARMLRVEC